MSRVRIRVDSRDWWASRMVVSVMSSFFWLSTHSFTASGPFSSSSALRPFRGFPVGVGKRGLWYCLRSVSGLST